MKLVRAKDGGDPAVWIQSKETGNFEVLDPSGSYRLATSRFVARGGDYYPKIDSMPTYKELAILDAEALRDLIRGMSPIDPEKFAPRGYFHGALP